MKKRVVVTGMGVMAPNGHGLKKFEQALRRGRSGIRYIPELKDLNFSCQVGGVPEKCNGNGDLSGYFSEEKLLSMNDNITYAALAAIEGDQACVEKMRREFEARREGAEGMSFDTIVATGLRWALPHGRASSQPLPSNGFIIIDWGVILAGYCSDLTRTVHIGSAPPKRKRMYQAVKDAQQASLEALRPGVASGKVDQAGRKVLEKAGFGMYFTHSTGHGVGLEVHEAPRLAKHSKETLTPGMIVTIEPGIYIPDEGGVRIEDMALITESGYEILTPAARDLITL